jgi:hypothetical protein
MGNIHQIYPPENTERWLSEDTQLWRYMPLKTLFFYVSGNVFIPSLAKLQQGDPFEGKFLFDTEDFEAALKDSCGPQFDRVQTWIRNTLWTPTEKHFFGQNREWAKLAVSTDKNRYFEFLSKTRYAWCWFQSDIESAAMWNTYGKEGVAIATTVGDLSSAIKTANYDFAFGRMCYFKRSGNYARCSNSEKQMFVLQPQFLKREEYDSEKEVRFVTYASECESGGLSLKDIEPETWIKKVRLWPGLTSREEDSIMSALKNKLSSADCQKSDLLQPDGREMSRTLEQIDALVVANAESQRKSCKDGVPALLKKL